MLEIILYLWVALVILAIVCVIVIGMVYGYWIFSIGMAPVLWVFIAVSVIVGFVCTLRNAIRAAIAVNKERE